MIVIWLSFVLRDCMVCWTLDVIIHYGSIIHFQELAAEISGLEKEKEELEAKLKKVFILFTY